ncbi:MAG: hypothetical protein AAF386_07715 [Pseudomonadota bacterium]
MLELLILAFFGIPAMFDTQDPSDDDATTTDSGLDDGDGTASTDTSGDLLDGVTGSTDDSDGSDDDTSADGTDADTTDGDDTSGDDTAADGDTSDDDTSATDIIAFTVDEDASGAFDISLDDGQSGSIIALKTDDVVTDFDQGDLSKVQSLGFYHLPDGATFEITDEMDDANGPTLESIVEGNNLTLLQEFDLGGQTVDYSSDGNGEVEGTTDTRTDPPAITVPDGTPIYRLAIEEIFGHTSAEIAQTDQGFSAFEPLVDTYEDRPAIDTDNGNATGTDLADLIQIRDSDGDNGLIYGGAGADVVDVAADGVTVYGGDDNDRVGPWSDRFDPVALEDIPFTNGTVFGGDGDDAILVGAGGSAFGEAGDDLVQAFSFEDVTTTMTEVFGGDGDDVINATGASAFGYGGSGDDSLTAIEGAVVFGETGDDTLSAFQGGIVDGGVGDDQLLAVTNDNDTAAASLAGGEGADTFIHRILGTDTDFDGSVVRISDFDTDEDVLAIDAANTVGLHAEQVSGGRSAAFLSDGKPRPG